MKKKARHMELVEMEQLYRALKAQEDLHATRKSRVVEIIKGVSSAKGDQAAKSCPHICHLRKLAAEKVQHAGMSIDGISPKDAVALSATNIATVKVLVSGADYASGKSNTLTAFCSVAFEATSTEITSISLFWVEQECHQCKMFPSISALSFETS